MIEQAKLDMMVSRFDDYTFFVNNPNEHMQKSWAAGNYYEPNMVEFIKNNYKGDTFIDIGSCMGNHTMYFARLADKVVSFEAFHYNHLQQSMNLFINKIQNVDLYNIGIGSEFKVLNFSEPEFDNAGSGHFDKDGKNKMVTAPLDSFGIEFVKLIKIDVEGFELNVLHGASYTIAKYTPDLFIECATEKDRDAVGHFLQGIDSRYRSYKTVFNYTPTYLFTVKEDKEFKEGKDEK